MISIYGGNFIPTVARYCLLYLAMVKNQRLEASLLQQSYEEVIFIVWNAQVKGRQSNPR